MSRRFTAGCTWDARYLKRHWTGYADTSPIPQLSRARWKRSGPWRVGRGIAYRFVLGPTGRDRPEGLVGSVNKFLFAAEPLKDSLRYAELTRSIDRSKRRPGVPGMMTLICDYAEGSTDNDHRSAGSAIAGILNDAIDVPPITNKLPLVASSSNFDQVPFWLRKSESIPVRGSIVNAPTARLPT